MTMIQTRPFVAGNSQAIRLPKAFAYPKDTPLMMTKEHDVITIRPVQNLAAVPALFAELGQVLGEFERLELDDNGRDWP